MSMTTKMPLVQRAMSKDIACSLYGGADAGYASTLPGSTPYIGRRPAKDVSRLLALSPGVELSLLASRMDLQWLLLGLLQVHPTHILKPQTVNCNT